MPDQYQLIKNKASNFFKLSLSLIFFSLLSCEENKKTVKVDSMRPLNKDFLKGDDAKIISKIKDIEVDDPFITKKLKLLITNNFNTYFVYKGEEVGLEFEILRLYAKDRGWELQLKHVHDLEYIQDSITANGAHLAAASFTIPPKLQNKILYSHPIYYTNLILVQNKKMAHDTNQIAYVIKDAPYVHAIWDDTIPPPPGLSYKYAHEHATKELLIEEVAENKIAYTVSDRHEAEIMQGLYPQLDISKIIRKKVPVAFVFHPKAGLLKKDFDQWLAGKFNTSDYQWTLKKYDNWPAKIRHTISYSLPALTEGRLSLFDDLVKKHAGDIDWDWKLLSALIYQESRFDPTKISGAGARGLMQIMPSVGEAYASLPPQELFHPIKNITAGTKYLKWLRKNFYLDSNISEEEKIKFILASYNAGPGHVQDARALAKKNGLNPNKWENNTELMMLAKSKPKYYRDPLSKHGYCRGKETVMYVKNIMNYFQHYSNYYSTSAKDVVEEN